MKTDNKLLKQIIKHYIPENEDIRKNQIDHRIELLQNQKEHIQNQIDHLKNSIDHLKDQKEKLSDLISKLRFEKQKITLSDKGII